MSKGSTFLILIPEEIKNISNSLRYASFRARESGGRVALLSIVEPEEIGAWGGVDKVLTDDAFDRARKVMEHYVAIVQELSGTEPLTLFRKGQRRATLLEVIESEPEISAFVLTAYSDEARRNTLIQYLTSEKGLKKLSIPLIVVPDNCCRYDVAEEKTPEEEKDSEKTAEDKTKDKTQDSGKEDKDVHTD